ncbi:MAG TPA: NAD(P)H-dependent oxidoreductase [Candidatus Saccharimonadales bacterium]|nr:NAD(P)H-dependent oxidoreductase [Candidatus Saccharimonadales bacterium]
MKIILIIGSSRPERKTEKFAKWVADGIKSMNGVELETVDLKEYDFPNFNEPISPRFNPDRKPEPKVKEYLDKLNTADAFVIATPEYNHSIPGVLKNALDYVDWQFNKKPVAIVSHGSAGGARATEHLKGIVSEIKGVAIPAGVAFTGASEYIDDNGKLNEELKAKPYGPQTALDATLNELMWYGSALAEARSKE